MNKQRQIERRQQRREREVQRARALRYCEQAGGTWALDDRELVELDSLVARIERAHRAQQQHDRRQPVQLTIRAAA